MVNLPPDELHPPRQHPRTGQSGQPNQKSCLVCSRQRLEENVSIVSFRWLKNHAPIEKSRRVKVRNRENSSRLVITELDVLDSGYYQCIATNSAASVNTTSVLRVSIAIGSTSATPITL